MRGVCEECLRSIETARCGEHPFARPLLLDDPADLELLKTLRGLRTARWHRSLLFAAPAAAVVVLTVAVAASGQSLLHGFVLSLLLLTGGLLAVLPVLAVLWVLAVLTVDLVVAVRRRLGWHVPVVDGLLPGVPILDPIRAAEEARAARTAHRAARAPQSTGPRFLH